MTFAGSVNLILGTGMMASVGCLAQLPPPAAPAQVVPQPATDIGPAAPGESTVLFGTDQPAQVSEVMAAMQTSYAVGGTMGVAQGMLTRPLCTTPCAAHLATGSHQLLFTDADGNLGGGSVIQVGARTSAYRYALGHVRLHAGARAGGLLALSLGISAVGTGLLFSSIGDDSLSGAGQGVTIAGVGLTAIGVALLVAFRPEIQPGTGVQWDLPGAEPSAPQVPAAITAAR